MNKLCYYVPKNNKHSKWPNATWENVDARILIIRVPFILPHTLRLSFDSMETLLAKDEYIDSPWVKDIYLFCMAGIRKKMRIIRAYLKFMVSPSLFFSLSLSVLATDYIGNGEKKYLP